MIKSISIFKVSEKKNEQSPDYRVTARVGEAFVDCGAGWIKEGKAGKFISIKFKDEYQDKCGFALVEESMKKLPESKQVTSAGTPVPFPNDEINPDNIPF